MEVAGDDDHHQPKSKSNDCGDADESHGQLNVPAPVLRRVNALRKIQLDSINIESEFYRKMHELECECASRLVPLHEKRRQIVNGLYDPNDVECELPVPFDQEFLAEELQKQDAIKRDLPDAEKNAADAEGIDEFWLTVFRNSSVMGSFIQHYDEPVLKHLTDVQATLHKEPMGFTLSFHFSPNEYFTNDVLTKEYHMKCEPDADDPFSFGGPDVVSCKGCKIDWKPGKNTTVKMMKKKQKHKQKGTSRIVSKEVKVDSFFNFFDPPEQPKEGDEATEMDVMNADLLSADYQLGQLLREHIIPHAVLYYTGETDDDDQDDDDYDDEEDDDDYDEDGKEDDDEEVESDEDVVVKRNDRGKPRKK